MSIDFREKEIAELSARILDLIKPLDADVGLKVAALRAAASTMTEAISIHSLATMLANMHDPRRP